MAFFLISYYYKRDIFCKFAVDLMHRCYLIVCGYNQHALV